MSSRRAMGALEAEVLGHLWAASQPLTPADVTELMSDTLAYTTVMTILTRLFQKGLVERDLVKRAYAYRPVVSEADLAARRMQETLQRVSDRDSALSSFVSSLSPKEAARLRRLLKNGRSRR